MIFPWSGRRPRPAPRGGSWVGAVQQWRISPKVGLGKLGFFLGRVEVFLGKIRGFHEEQWDLTTKVVEHWFFFSSFHHETVGFTLCFDNMQGKIAHLEMFYGLKDRDFP